MAFPNGSRVKECFWLHVLWELLVHCLGALQVSILTDGFLQGQQLAGSISANGPVHAVTAEHSNQTHPLPFVGLGEFL